MLRERRIPALLVLAIGAIPAWGLIYGLALPALDAPWIAPNLKSLLAAKIPGGHGPVMIAGYGEPSALIALGTTTQFGNGEQAARWLTDTPNAVAIVSQDQAASFTAALDQGHVPVETLGTVSGLNYSKGKNLTLTLYRRSAN